jgi:tripartite ATP-independent transporter DctM subunit
MMLLSPVGLLVVSAGLFFFLGMPIAFCLGASSLVYFLAVGNIPLHGIAQKMIYAGDNFLLLAIPLFILAAHVMNATGSTERIFAFANSLVRHITGGLAHVNVLSNMIFAGMSGSALADMAGLGVLQIEAMTKSGYDRDFSVALSASAATIGPIIPPSIPFVIYCWISGASVGEMFLAGFLPGVLMGVLMMIVSYFLAKRRNYPKFPRASLGEVGRSLYHGILPLMAPVIILGGMYTGAFTPTEAAMVATIYAIALGALVFRAFAWPQFPALCLRVLKDTAVAMYILATATAFNWILTREQIPAKIGEYTFQLTQNPYLLLLIINIFLLILGCFMENTAILIIFTPILLPIVTQFGMSPVHFGVVLVLNVMIGTLTPPFGIVLYMASAVSKLSVERISIALIPYIAILIVNLMLVTYIPPIAMTLPNLFTGK